jgi:TonB family protein
MAPQIFGEIANPSIRVGTRQWYTVPVSVLTHMAVLAARVSGVVILEAVIGPDGRVTDLRVLRSVALLDDAAIAAVQQWMYSPTRLNGVPVPVIMTVTVTFTMR